MTPYSFVKKKVIGRLKAFERGEMMQEKELMQFNLTIYVHNKKVLNDYIFTIYNLYFIMNLTFKYIQQPTNSMIVVLAIQIELKLFCLLINTLAYTNK